MLAGMNNYAELSRAELADRLMTRDAQVAALEQAAREPDVAGGRDRAALADSEERIRAILQTAVEGIITIDGHGLIESVNPAAEKIFGWTAAELFGRNISMLMPAPYRAEHDGYLSRYQQTGRAKIIGIGREVTGKRKDGSHFPMDLSVGEMLVAGRRMFTGIIRDITERRRLEREILEITDREQRRIGQDLHDGLGQHLTGIELLAEVLQQKLAARSPAHSARAGEITKYVREAIQQTKLLARGLAPVVVESEGLMSALCELAVHSEKLFGVHCVVHCPAPVLLADHTVALHLYRIAQEAVTNAIRHGQAKTITLRLAVAHGHLELRIADNGLGLPAGAPSADERPPGSGMGLRIMRYRAGMIGGDLAFAPNPGGGLVVSCSLRLPGAEAPAERSHP